MIDRLGSIQQTGQTQATGGVSVTVDERTAQRLNNLSSGDTLQGRVVNITTDAQGNRTAQVDLGDGATVNARLAPGTALQVGESISFNVRTTGETFTLNPLFTNTAMNSTISQALSAAGMTPTDTLTQMVQSMMNEGMSIDRNALLQMAGNLTAYPEANAATLVHMAHLNVPLTENNIEMFNAYETYEHQVVAGMEQIFDALPDSFNAMLQEDNFNSAMDLYGDIMNLFSGEEALSGEGLTQAAAQEGAMPLPADAALAGATEAELTEDTGALSAAGTLQEGVEEAAEGGKTPPQEALQKAISDATDVAAQNRLSADVGAPESTSQMTFSKAFTDLLRTLNVSEERIAGLSNPQQTAQGEDPFGALIKELSEVYAKTAHTSDAVDKTWTSLFSTKEYNAVLKEAISNQWLIKPEAVADKQNVESLYRRLNAQTKALTDILQSSAGVSEKLTQSVNTLAKNVDFMQEMNQMYSYVQLPLKLAGDNAHGDLYVYRNRHKNMAEEDGTTSAVLHLDMDNLGPLDVLIKLKDTAVTTNFYLADDAAMDLIEAHVDELEARILKRGYSVTITTGLKEDLKKNPAVDELLQVATERTAVFQGAFDARA